MTYIHGYAKPEQERLVKQAHFWRKSLIPLEISYQFGEQVLEIGCGVGAVLGVLTTDFPGIKVAGIDLEPAQIECATQHLASLGINDADLRVGDAAALPWADESFDHVYITWLLEHLSNALPVLREAKRVLRPGGSIVLTEADYTTFKVYPTSPYFDYLERAQYELFSLNGNPNIGRLLGPLLCKAGFTDVCSKPVGFHFFNCSKEPTLREWVEYVAEFLEPMIPLLVKTLGLDEQYLTRGLDHLRSIPDYPISSMTAIVYRAHAQRAIESLRL